MAQRKPKKKPKERQRALRSDFKGLKAVLVRLEARHDDALAAEASRRAKAKGISKTDKSEIVREALELHPDLKGR